MTRGDGTLSETDTIKLSIETGNAPFYVDVVLRNMGLDGLERPPTMPSAGRNTPPLDLQATWGIRRELLQVGLGPEGCTIALKGIPIDEHRPPHPDWATEPDWKPVPFVLSSFDSAQALLRAEAMNRVDVLMKRDDPFDYNFQISSPYRNLLKELTPRIYKSVQPLVNRFSATREHFTNLSSLLLDSALEYGRLRLEWDLYAVRMAPLEEGHNERGIAASGWEGWGREAFRLGMRINFLLLERRSMLLGLGTEGPGVIMRITRRLNEEKTAQLRHSETVATTIEGPVFDAIEPDEREFLALRVRLHVPATDPRWMGSMKMNVEELRQTLHDVGQDPDRPTRGEIACYRVGTAAQQTTNRLQEKYKTNVTDWPPPDQALGLAALEVLRTVAERGGSLADDEAQALADRYGVSLS